MWTRAFAPPEIMRNSHRVSAALFDTNMRKKRFGERFAVARRKRKFADHPAATPSHRAVDERVFELAPAFIERRHREPLAASAAAVVTAEMDAEGLRAGVLDHEMGEHILTHEEHLAV